MKTQLKKYFKLFKKYLRSQWKSVFVLVVVIFGSIGIQLINPQILRGFIDAAADGAPTGKLINAGLIFIVISIIKQVLAIATTYTCQNVGWKATNALREDLIEHCIKLDMNFHKTKQPGEMIERVDSDVNKLFDFFSKLVLDIGSSVFLMIGILIMLLREDIRVGMALTIYCIASIIIMRKYQKKGIPLWAEAQEANGKFFGFLGEQLTNTEDIKSCGAVNNSMYKYHKTIKGWFPTFLKASMAHFKMWNLSTIIEVVGVTTGLGFGFYLWKQGDISIGTVYLIFNYTNLINGPLHLLRRKMGDLQKAEASIVRVQELFEMESSIIDGEETLQSNSNLPVTIKNLDFEYTEGIKVLKNISLKLEHKKVLGVLGRTGSGKTTLARLLVRLYEPSSGEIFIGDTRLKNIRMDSLKKHVAYVTQDVHIFNASVRENLTLFDFEISDDEIMKALENAGLLSWIQSLPEGLDTMLDSAGSSLSAGQAQLIAFARVFLKNPGLVILDEASSRLDPITEKAMEGAIDKLLINSSCIIIAHRLSTLQRADDILILNDGEILEYGTREELLKDSDSKYHNLLQKGIEEVLV